MWGHSWQQEPSLDDHLRMIDAHEPLPRWYWVTASLVMTLITVVSLIQAVDAGRSGDVSSAAFHLLQPFAGLGILSISLFFREFERYRQPWR